MAPYSLALFLSHPSWLVMHWYSFVVIISVFTWCVIFRAGNRAWHSPNPLAMVVDG